jgi:hypothetical protein
LASTKNFPDPPEPGVIIFLHPKESLIGWMVMFVTDSPISHVASSVDAGDVVDVSLEGARRYPFDDLLDEVSLISMVKPAMSELQVRSLVTNLNSTIGRVSYSYTTAIQIALRSCIGISNTFNWRLYLDVATWVTFVGAALGKAMNHALVFATIFAVSYVAATAVNAYRSLEQHRRNHAGQGRSTWNM